MQIRPLPQLRPTSQAGHKSEEGFPIHDLAYVSAFMGPMSAGPLVGMLAGSWLADFVGLAIGVGISLLNAWLSDRFIDPWIAALQRPLQKGLPRLLVNVAAFAWAMARAALARLAPLWKRCVKPEKFGDCFPPVSPCHCSCEDATVTCHVANK